MKKKVIGNWLSPEQTQKDLQSIGQTRRTKCLNFRCSARKSIDKMFALNNREIEWFKKFPSRWTEVTLAADNSCTTWRDETSLFITGSFNFGTKQKGLLMSLWMGISAFLSFQVIFLINQLASYHCNRKFFQWKINPKYICMWKTQSFGALLIKWPRISLWWKLLFVPFVVNRCGWWGEWPGWGLDGVKW